jgi:Mn2+/Fe2+ NRAMP family transporter
VAVFFRGNVIYALIMAQASTMLTVPLIAVGLFLVLNNKKVMGEYRNNTMQNIIAVTGFLVVSIMVYFMYQNIAAHIRTT